MRWVKETVGLLIRYRRLPWFLSGVIILSALGIFSVLLDKQGSGFIPLFILILAAWEISDVHLFKQRDMYRSMLEDADDEAVMLKGRILQLEEENSILKVLSEGKRDNPIKGNRIVCDRTFAVRLRNFANSIIACDPACEEEQQYFASVADRLLKWQTKTVRKDSEEYRYLERIGLMPNIPCNVEDHTAKDHAGNKRRQASRIKRKQAEHGNETKD